MATTNDAPLAEINITPLVDVMLVLLVIFMIAAPALTNTLSLKLLQSPPVAPKEVPELAVQVQAGDLFALDGRPVSQRELGEAVRAALVAQPDLRVTFDVDAEAEYASAMTAMTTVRNAGVEAIAFVNH